MQELDDLINRAVNNGVAPGIIVKATSSARPLYFCAAGQRSVTDPQPMAADALFRSYALTHLVAAVATARMIEDDLLDLDVPVADILPEFGAVKLHLGFENGEARQTPPAAICTLRHLVTHSAGFVYEQFSADMRQLLEARGARSISEGRRRGLMSYPMMFEPGSGAALGPGMDWLGLAIEALSGERLDHYLDRVIFAPLGMTETSMTYGEVQMEQLVGCQWAGEGGFRPVRAKPETDPEYISLSGPTYTNSRDAMRLLRMVLNGGQIDGQRVLSAESAARIGRRQINGLTLPRLPSAMAQLAHDLNWETGAPHELGLVTPVSTVDAPGRRRKGSMGFTGHFNTRFWIDPTSDIACLFLVQALPFAEPGLMRLMRAIETFIYLRHGDLARKRDASVAVDEDISPATVRDAKLRDLPAIVDLLSGDPHARLDHGVAIEQYRRAFVETELDPRNFILVAELDGEVVGCVQLTYMIALSDGGVRRGFLEGLRVAPGARGRRIGRALIEEAAQRARAAGCARLQASSGVERRDAHKFYRRNGFNQSHLGMTRPL